MQFAPNSGKLWQLYNSDIEVGPSHFLGMFNLASPSCFPVRLKRNTPHNADIARNSRKILDVMRSPMYFMGREVRAAASDVSKEPTRKRMELHNAILKPVACG